MDRRDHSLGERELHTIFDCFDDLVFLFDGQGRVRHANSVARDRLGYSRAELAETDLGSLCPGISHGALRERMSGNPEKACDCEQQELQASRGVRIKVRPRFVAARLLGADYYVGIFRDITNQLKSENALKESERKLSTLMSNLPGMAYRCKNNRNWTMEFVSDGCYDLTGYTPDELLGDKAVAFRELIQEEDRQNVWDGVQEALNKRQFYRLIFLMTTKSGERKWVWEQGVGIFSENGEVVALEGLLTDFSEHQRSKQQLHIQNIILRSNVKESYRFCDIVGRSDVMQQVFDNILRAANSEANVIIYGESGTGKELVARAIHKMCPVRDQPFVPVNCGAIPESLMESEFFGYKKGAFTDAKTDKPGYLELAEGGTLFLDEIGEINLNIQVKLLRAIEGTGFTPVGDSQVKKPKFRIIAATNKDLKALINKGLLREDFFYRIHIIPLTLPPLRERKEDIPLLVYHFLKSYSHTQKDVIPQDILNAMQKYDWPGNVRELQNTIHRYVTLNTIDATILDPTGAVALRHLKETVDMSNAGGATLQAAVEEFESRLIRGLLDKHGWHRGVVAELLDINYRTLLRKMKKYGLGGEMRAL